MELFARRHRKLVAASTATAEQSEELSGTALRLSASARMLAAAGAAASRFGTGAPPDGDDVLASLGGRVRHRLFVRRLKRRGGNGGAPARLMSPLRLAASIAR